MKKDDYNQKALVDFSLKVAGDIGATIAVPVTSLTYLAKKVEPLLELKKPQLVIFAILGSFLLSTIMVSKKAVKYGEQYEGLTAPEAEVEIVQNKPPNEENLI